MKRKKQKSSSSRTRPARTIAQKDDGFVFVQSRGPQHRRALSKLEKKFGRKDFNPSDAGRSGVDRQLLRELVQFNQVLSRSEDRYAINQDASAHAVEFETPIQLYKASYSMFENLPEDSPLRKTMIMAERPPVLEEEEKPNPLALDPMHVTKRFQMPYWLYLEIRPDIENLSAYIRFCIYTDRGMEEEAQIEKDRMGDSTREDK